jgi:cell division septation protein DedD
MNINYKQPQFELFPANSASLEDINKPKFLLANLTLSLESLVIFTILGIMVALFSFSLGVERGKHLAAQALDERVSAAWNVGARTAAPAAAVAAVPQKMVQQRTMPQRINPQRLVLQRTAPMAFPKPAAVPVQKPWGLPGATHYTLQGATYGNEEYAKADALALRAKGFQSFLIKSGKYWLVCIGNFGNKESATAFLRKLPGQYRASQVRRF